MAISKIILNNVVQMDDTANTITSDKILNGYIGKGADGETVTGNIPNGTATSASSITGTGATASSSGTTITLTKSVSNTPRITTAGYISSGTAGSSSISLSATDADFLPENIRKNVNIFGKVGTYEGSGGSVTLKMGVVRPDAELLQTWSGDYLLHTDKGITIPAYSTSTTILFTGGTALTPTVTLSNANYRYYLIQRFLTIPQYSITTLAKGRQEYTAMSMCYEIVAYPANTFSALINTTKYGSRNTAMIPAGNSFVRNVYWSSASALSVYTANTYGCAQTIQTAPSISSGTAASPTLTVYDPNATIRGSTTYLVNTFYNAITDIRCQYVIELYRIPASTSSTYGIDGWGHYTQMLHNITCAQSSTHKLS